jgi:hypothetical protein
MRFLSSHAKLFRIEAKFLLLRQLRPVFNPTSWIIVETSMSLACHLLSPSKSALSLITLTLQRFVVEVNLLPCSRSAAPYLIVSYWPLSTIHRVAEAL